MSIFLWRLDGFSKNVYLDIFILGFFRKPEKLGSHTGSKWWPGDPDEKDDPNDPLTRWPNDPVPCLMSVSVCLSVGHGRELCKIGWTDRRHAVSGMKSNGSKAPCFIQESRYPSRRRTFKENLGRSTEKSNLVVHDSECAQMECWLPNAMLPTGRCYS